MAEGHVCGRHIPRMNREVWGHTAQMYSKIYSNCIYIIVFEIKEGKYAQ